MRRASSPHATRRASCARARRPRWRSAASSSAGGGETPCPRLPARGRPRCGTRPIESRPRSPARAAAVAVPPRARAGASRGSVLVRRARSGGARRVASRPRSGRRPRLPEPRGGRLPRARRPRSRSRRACHGCEHGRGARSLVALGRPLRSAGHAPRIDGGRPPRSGCLKPHTRCVTIVSCPRREWRQGASARRCGSSPRPSRGERRR